MRLDCDYSIKTLSGVDKVFVYKETYSSNLEDCGYYAPVEKVASADALDFDTYLIDGVRWVDSGKGSILMEGIFTSEIIPPNDTMLFKSRDDFLLAMQEHVTSLFRDVYQF